MTIVAKAYLDIVCEVKSCGTELSAYTETGYATEAEAREEAVEHDWQWTPDGGDRCPAHRTDRQRDDS